MVMTEQKEDFTIQALEQLTKTEDVCPPRPWETEWGTCPRRKPGICFCLRIGSLLS